MSHLDKLSYYARPNHSQPRALLSSAVSRLRCLLQSIQVLQLCRSSPLLCAAFLAELEPSTHSRSAVDVAADCNHTKAIALSGLSKTYSCPGLRTGWLASKDRATLKRIEGLKDYTTICSCAPGEVLSIMALKRHERIAAGNRELIRTNIVAANSFFDRHEDEFEWHGPAAGSVAFPRCVTVLHVVTQTD